MWIRQAITCAFGIMIFGLLVFATAELVTSLVRVLFTDGENWGLPAIFGFLTAAGCAVCVFIFRPTPLREIIKTFRFVGLLAGLLGKILLAVSVISFILLFFTGPIGNLP